MADAADIWHLVEWRRQHRRRRLACHQDSLPRPRFVEFDAFCRVRNAEAEDTRVCMYVCQRFEDRAVAPIELHHCKQYASWCFAPLAFLADARRNALEDFESVRLAVGREGDLRPRHARRLERV